MGDEIVQALDHHFMPIFDNLRELQNWQSDILCQASTGGSFTKRQLYTDTEDVISSFVRPIVLTGINLPTVAPDLLQGSRVVDSLRADLARSAQEGSGALEAI